MIWTNVQQQSRRVTALILAGIMAASLSACGGKSTQEASPTVGTVKQAGEMHVYSSKTLDATGLHLEHINRFQSEGGRIYGFGNGPDENGDWQNFIVSFAMEGESVTDPVKHVFPLYKSADTSAACMDEEGNIYAVVRSYTVMEYTGEEGDIPAEVAEMFPEEMVDEAMGEETASSDAEEVMEEEYAPVAAKPFAGEVVNLEEATLPATEKETENYLLKYDAQGALVYAVALDEKLTSSEYFYVNSIVATADAVLISSEGNIGQINAQDGSFVAIVAQGGNGGWLYLTKLKDNRVILHGYGSEGLLLQEIDLAAHKIGTSYEMSGYINPDSMTAGGDYDVCWSDSGGVFGMNLGDESGTELLNFVDSDMVSTGLYNYVVLDDGRILANVDPNNESYYGAFGSSVSYSDGSQSELTLMTKVPAGEIKEKEVLTLGCLYSDSHIASEVVKFNKESDTYRIRIINYMNTMSANDYNAALEAFNSDIVTGNMPDMVILDTSMPMESYYAKRVFEPLDSYLENDAELKDAEFMDNVLEAMKHQGTTYLLTPGFAAITISAKAKAVQGHDTWTIEAFEKVIDESGIPYEKTFGYSMDAATLLQYFVLFNSGSFIDYSEHKCNFNSPEFMRLLELAQKFPAQNSNETSYEYDDTAWREGRALFELTSLGDFDSYWRAKYISFGEDVAFIGFPTATGENGSSFMPDSPIAMSASGTKKDACWEFMRRLYSDEYQEGINWSFPVRLSALEKKAQKATEPEMWYNPVTKKMEEQESYWGIGDTSIKKTPLTKEETEEVIAFLKTLNVTASFNQQISEIIQEDAAPFFKGQKSKEEVAGIIQSRVQVYLNENS